MSEYCDGCGRWIQSFTTNLCDDCKLEQEGVEAQLICQDCGKPCGTHLVFEHSHRDEQYGICDDCSLPFAPARGQS